MAYAKQTWVNGVVGGTPLSEARLNHIEDGIEGVETAAVQRVLKTGDTMTGPLALAAGAPGVGGLTIGGDTNLYRSSAAAILKTDGSLNVVGGILGSSSSITSVATGTNSFTVQITGDTESRLYIKGDGTHLWGPGGVTPPDTNLYRSAANTLKTDDSLDVVGTLAVTGNAGFNGATPAAKPTITGSRGGNVAVASLLTALASMGLITDSTTA